MPNTNSPRYQRWFTQQQSTLLAFNNSSGIWAPSGAQLQRVDANSMSPVRNAPYSRFPVLTGTRSEVPGIRGRKAASWSIRGMPVIPSGTAGTVPDLDNILQNIFGQAATIVGGTSATYSFNDTGYLAFSILGFVHGFTSLTSRALWGCFVTRATFNFDGPFMTVDLEGFAGYLIDSTGFSVFDTQAVAGLTAFPIEPSSPTINGNPITGFGTGFTATIDGQQIALNIRGMSISIETGFVPVGDTYGSPYLTQVVGDARRIAINLTDILDDDSAQLNDIKTKADTDNVTINLSILAGNVAGSKLTFNLNNVQPNAFNLRDNGAAVALELPTSYAHATSPGLVNDMTMVCT